MIRYHQGIEFKIIQHHNLKRDVNRRVHGLVIGQILLDFRDGNCSYGKKVNRESLPKSYY